MKELFEAARPLETKRTRAELLKNIDADYYGYRDEEDGTLLEAEKSYMAKSTFSNEKKLFSYILIL